MEDERYHITHPAATAFSEDVTVNELTIITCTTGQKFRASIKYKEVSSVLGVCDILKG